MHHIKNTLPDIKSKISSGLAKYQQELAQLGDPMGISNGNEVRDFSLFLFHHFCLTFILFIVKYHFEYHNRIYQ
jgi:vacuolar protein sorting-associated protein 1